MCLYKLMLATLSLPSSMGAVHSSGDDMLALWHQDIFTGENSDDVTMMTLCARSRCYKSMIL